MAPLAPGGPMASQGPQTERPEWEPETPNGRGWRGEHDGPGAKDAALRSWRSWRGRERESRQSPAPGASPAFSPEKRVGGVLSRVVAGRTEHPQQAASSTQKSRETGPRREANHPDARLASAAPHELRKEAAAPRQDLSQQRPPDLPWGEAGCSQSPSSQQVPRGPLSPGWEPLPQAAGGLGGALRTGRAPRPPRLGTRGRLRERPRLGSAAGPK